MLWDLSVFELIKRPITNLSYNLQLPVQLKAWRNVNLLKNTEKCVVSVYSIPSQGVLHVVEKWTNENQRCFPRYSLGPDSEQLQQYKCWRNCMEVLQHYRKKAFFLFFSVLNYMLIRSRTRRNECEKCSRGSELFVTTEFCFLLCLQLNPVWTQSYHTAEEQLFMILWWNIKKAKQTTEPCLLSWELLLGSNLAYSAGGLAKVSAV